MPEISTNTQAIILLTQPLIGERNPPRLEHLQPYEYGMVIRSLGSSGRRPADLFTMDATELFSLSFFIGQGKVKRLLARKPLLRNAIKRWKDAGIWVLSRDDEQYPQRLKERLRDNQPILLYGTGDVRLLNDGGIAVIGDPKPSAELSQYATEIGAIAAAAGRSVITGGALNVGQTALLSSLEAGGSACSVLPGSLDTIAARPENIAPISSGRLVLMSPYDPYLGHQGSRATACNKLLFALADAALIVSANYKTGAAWDGAVEQLEKLKLVPVYTRSTGEHSAGLDNLCAKGAIQWPNPTDVGEFNRVLNVKLPTANVPSPQQSVNSAVEEQASPPMPLPKPTLELD